MSVEFENLKVLVVENADLLGDMIETVLKSVNTKQVFVARSSDHALVTYQIHKHDLLIIDLDINTDGGIGLTQKVRDGSPDAPVILMPQIQNG